MANNMRYSRSIIGIDFFGKEICGSSRGVSLWFDIHGSKESSSRSSSSSRFFKIFSGIWEVDVLDGIKGFHFQGGAYIFLNVSKDQSLIGRRILEHPCFWPFLHQVELLVNIKSRKKLPREKRKNLPVTLIFLTFFLLFDS